MRRNFWFFGSQITSLEVCARGRARAFRGLLRCGARRREHRPGYYTNLHERDDFKAYRLEYLHANRELGWRTAMWVQLTVDEYRGKVKTDERLQVEMPFFSWREDGEASECERSEATHVEMHCDDFEEASWRDRIKASVRWAHATTCTRGHEKGVCRCGKEVIRCGQDKSIFKANVLPRGFWEILGG